jgi:uncharacterized protein
MPDDRPTDCLTCGACCTSPDENRREGFVDYVEVAAGSELLRRDDHRKRFVVFNAQGMPHMRMDAAHRCAALNGRLGVRVRCVVYAYRPRACRLVQPGDRRCVQYRRERGMSGRSG